MLVTLVTAVFKKIIRRNLHTNDLNLKINFLTYTFLLLILIRSGGWNLFSFPKINFFWSVSECVHALPHHVSCTYERPKRVTDSLEPNL